jgi:hypothetical protein
MVSGILSNILFNSIGFIVPNVHTEMFIYLSEYLFIYKIYMLLSIYHVYLYISFYIIKNFVYVYLIYFALFTKYLL